MSAGLQSRCSLEQSRRLWSLSALMLKKAALEFGRVCAQLQQLESACEMARRVAPQITTDHTGFLASVANTILGNLKRVCISGGLDNVLPEVERFGVALLGDFTIVEIKAKAEHLRLRLYDELENEFYFQVSRQDVAIYDQKELFGPAVAKKFKNAATDIAKAGNCLALQEPTACVFHLMRAMEVAVRRLSKRLGITI